MSQKGSYTTSDPLPWDEAIMLIQELGKRRQWKYQLLITSGIFFGLRISDILKLRWDQILGKEKMIINEQKTSKKRVIDINPAVQKIFVNAYMEMNPANDFIFPGKNGDPMTKQPINRFLKTLIKSYSLSINRFSTHSLRKCFGVKLFELKGKTFEALLLIMAIFNHRSPQTTMIYLGITQDDISHAYQSLSLTDEQMNLIVNSDIS